TAIVALGLGDFVAAPLAQRAHAERSLHLSAGQALATAKGMWARDGRRFVNIRRAEGPDHLSGVSVYEFDEDRRLTSVLRAENATWGEGGWVLSNVVRTTVGPEGAETRADPSLTWASDLVPRQ